MENSKIFKVLDRFKFIYEKFGVNYELMKKILNIKLILDNRRIPTVYNNNNNKEKKQDGAFRKTFIGYFIMGIFMGLIVLTPSPMILKMAINLGAILFLIMTTMISDFSSVLLDIKDKNILNTKPIDEKTINAAKTTHIFIYIIGITFSIAGPTFIIGTIKYKLTFFLIYLVEIILMLLFIVFFTSILYYFILKFFDGEKLKDIINYFQIILSVVMILGYQVVPRMFDFSSVGIFTVKWWSYFIPSIWFAAPYGVFIDKLTSTNYIVLSVLSVLIPIGIFVIYNKYIVPYFESNLRKLEDVSYSKSSKEEIKGIRNKKISRVFCRDKTENIFFRFSKNMMATERKFKLRLYPNLSFAIIFPFIMLLNSFSRAESFSKAIEEISTGSAYMWIYLTILLIVTNIYFINTSEKYKGAWIYEFLPIEDQSKIQKGSIKGMVSKYCMPVFLIVSFIFLLICGIRILPDLIIMFLAMLILSAVVYKTNKDKMPFNEDFDNKGGTTLLNTLILGIVVGIFALIHFYVAIKTNYNPLTYGYIVLLIIVNLFMWRK